MKNKCDHCHGKGGWSVEKLLIAYWQPCQQCMGKGVWWPKKKPKRKKTNG